MLTFNFFGISGWGIDLDYWVVEWFALETVWDLFFSFFFFFFWDCTQELHFSLFCWLWGLLHFFYGILAHGTRFNGHLNLIFPFLSILAHWFLRGWCSILLSPTWPQPIYLDSQTQHSRCLCNSVYIYVYVYVCIYIYIYIYIHTHTHTHTPKVNPCVVLLVYNSHIS